MLNREQRPVSTGDTGGSVLYVFLSNVEKEYSV